MEQQVERRIVSVLFADLVGFTPLSERLDAEDVATIQDAYFAMVRETVGRYGGVLEKFIGDAAMATFGADRARDDDAPRAVRAGMALVHGIQQIAAELGLDDEALQLRVGVNTGEVVTAVTGPDAGRVTGDTVNTAARLQAAAPAGGVLVGEATALAVAEVAELVPIEPLELKGKAERQPASLVAGLRAEPSREMAMGDLRAPTIGRRAELDRLAEAWQRAGAGMSERWLVVAPPGVGKSRLLREIGAQVEGAAWAGRLLRARARPEAVSPFEPVAELLVAAMTASGLGAAGEAAARELLDRRLSDAGVAAARREVVVGAVVAAIWPSAAVAAGTRPAVDRDALFGAWLEALDALAGAMPEAWLVEDVHWAAPDVLAFLDAVAVTPGGSRTGRAGRLVVATARPSLLDAQPAWAAAAPETGRHRLDLATLEPGDARSLIEALVGDALPDELATRIAERSDGNCLFIEELLRTWASVGTLVREPDGWRLAVAASEVSLPTSVHSIYAAQLDDLPPDARLLARRASVAGRRFAAAALEPLGVEAARRDEGLAVLVRRQLVSGPVTEPSWPEVFSYRHALLREAGYSSLARAERARLHLRLARWLEASAGGHADELAEVIAGHYATALDSAPSLAREVDDGADRDSVRRLAAHWSEVAGRLALALSAHDAARTQLRRSIELTAAGHDLDLGRRWEALADATAHAADMDEGAAAYQRAIEHFRAAFSGPAEGAADADAERAAARSGLARATAALCEVWYEQLRFGEARDLAAELLEELGSGDPLAEARLLIARGLSIQGASGEQPGVADDLRRALALARGAGDQRLELEALGALALVEHEGGRGDPAAWVAVQQMAEQLGDWPTALSALANQAMDALDDHAASVPALCDRGRELALARGRTEDAGWYDYVAAEAAFVSGDWDRAVAVGLRAVELGEANAYRRLTVRTWHVLVPIAAARGDTALLERAARWYAALDIPLPDSPYARVMRPAQDLSLADGGLAAHVTPDSGPRIDSFDETPGGPSWTTAADRVFRAWIEAGDLDGAARALATLDRAAAARAPATSLGRGAHELLRGRLSLARGERDEAASAARHASERFRESAAPWWLAKALRLLERAGGASPELIAEAARIEHDLGLVEPAR